MGHSHGASYTRDCQTFPFSPADPRPFQGKITVRELSEALSLCKAGRGQHSSSWTISAGFGCIHLLEQLWSREPDAREPPSLFPSNIYGPRCGDK